MPSSIPTTGGVFKAKGEGNLAKGAEKLVTVWGSELMEYFFGPEHPFGPQRASLTFSLMEQVGLLRRPGVEILSPEKATREDLLLFHTPEMIDFVQEACRRGYGYLDGGDTPALPGGFEAGLSVVGSSWKMVEKIARGESRYGFNLVAGLHHAHPGRASGFCIFNDLAIDIIKLRRDYGIKRIAYIDIDAHHGDGVVYGFYNDPDLLTVDFHEDGRYLFPGTGEMHEMGRGLASGLKFNLPLPPYSSDQSLIYSFDQLVPPLLRNFKPEFIMFVCGVDAHGGDPLSDMNYSSASYTHSVRSLRNLAEELCDGRLAIFGAGGYSVGTCALRWTEVMAALLEHPLPDFLPPAWRDEFKQLTGEDAPVTFEENFTSDNTSSRVEDMVEWFKTRAKILSS